MYGESGFLAAVALLSNGLLDQLQPLQMILLELGGFVEDIDGVGGCRLQQRLDLLLLLRKARRHVRQRVDHVFGHRGTDERFQRLEGEGREGGRVGRKEGGDGRKDGREKEGREKEGREEERREKKGGKKRKERRKKMKQGREKKERRKGRKEGESRKRLTRAEISRLAF